MDNLIVPPKVGVTCTFRWSMAHRLGAGYKGKCQHLHGHNYQLAVTLTGLPTKVRHGMVYDFGDLKTLFGNWLDREWDHGTVIAAHDTALRTWCIDQHQKYYLLSADLLNSTAECLLQALLRAQADWLYGDAQMTALVLHETEDSYASWHRAN